MVRSRRSRTRRDAIRKIRKSATSLPAVTVLVRGGSYELGETLRFVPEDGGSSSSRSFIKRFPVSGRSSGEAAGSPGSSLMTGRS